MNIAAIITITLLTSIIVFMLFYIRWLLRTLSSIDDNITKLWVDISSFNGHIKKVHDTEMFYGDSTLQALMDHSRQLSDNIELIKDFFLPEEDGEYESASEKEEE